MSYQHACGCAALFGPKMRCATHSPWLAKTRIPPIVSVNTRMVKPIHARNLIPAFLGALAGSRKRGTLFGFEEGSADRYTLRQPLCSGYSRSAWGGLSLGFGG